MDRLRFSIRFGYIANIVVIDGEIVKNLRGKEMTAEFVQKEIRARNKVVVQTNGNIKFYFKEEDKHMITSIVDSLSTKSDFIYSNIEIIS